VCEVLITRAHGPFGSIVTPLHTLKYVPKQLILQQVIYFMTQPVPSNSSVIDQMPLSKFQHRLKIELFSCCCQMRWANGSLTDFAIELYVCYVAHSKFDPHQCVESPSQEADC
jgi:hypothetical protein